MARKTRWEPTESTSGVHMRCACPEGMTEEWKDTKTGCTLLFRAKPFEFMNRWEIRKPNGMRLTENSPNGINKSEYLSEPNRPKVKPPTTWANKLIKKYLHQ